MYPSTSHKNLPTPCRLSDANKAGQWRLPDLLSQAFLTLAAENGLPLESDALTLLRHAHGNRRSYANTKAKSSGVVSPMAAARLLLDVQRHLDGQIAYRLANPGRPRNESYFNDPAWRAAWELTQPPDVIPQPAAPPVFVPPALPPQIIPVPLAGEVVSSDY